MRGLPRPAPASRPLVLGLAAAAALCLGPVAPGPAAADGVTRAIDAARAAWVGGDAGGALAALAAAARQIRAQQAGALAALLPAAPAGWTRSIVTSPAAADANGGAEAGAQAEAGAGAEARATYARGDDRMTLAVAAGGPAAAALRPLFASPSVLATAGTVEHFGGRPFLREGAGAYVTLLDAGTVLFAEGSDPAALRDLLGRADFAAFAAAGGASGAAAGAP